MYVCMYVYMYVYIYIWIYEYFYANEMLYARMFASLFRVEKKRNSLSRGKLTQVRARRGRFLGRLSERRLCSHGFFRRVFGPWIGATTRACAIHALPPPVHPCRAFICKSIGGKNRRTINFVVMLLDICTHGVPSEWKCIRLFERETKPWKIRVIENIEGGGSIFESNNTHSYLEYKPAILT